MNHKFQPFARFISETRSEFTQNSVEPVVDGNMDGRRTRFTPFFPEVKTDVT